MQCQSNILFTHSESHIRLECPQNTKVCTLCSESMMCRHILMLTSRLLEVYTTTHAHFHQVLSTSAIERRKLPGSSKFSYYHPQTMKTVRPFIYNSLQSIQVRCSTWCVTLQCVTVIKKTEILGQVSTCIIYHLLWKPSFRDL